VGRFVTVGVRRCVRSHYFVVVAVVAVNWCGVLLCVTHYSWRMCVRIPEWRWLAGGKNRWWNQNHRIGFPSFRIVDHACFDFDFDYSRSGIGDRTRRIRRC